MDLFNNQGGLNMDINAVKSATTSVYEENKKTTEVKTETTAEQSSKKTETSDAAVYEKSSEKTSTVNKKTIQEMLNESNQKTESFKKLISSLFSKQSSKNLISGKKSSNTAISGYEMPTTNLKDFFSNLEVDEATRLQAQEDISEDGYYGVKQTSARILDFAMAIAGDDPDKIAEMRKAVEKGFEQAERMWGGELPSICQDTYDTVMAGFDKWSREASGSTEE